MQYRSPAVVLLSLVLEFAIPHSTWSDSTKGSQLAQQWCANCHVTSGSPAGNVQHGPPSFRTIAAARTADGPVKFTFWAPGTVASGTQIPWLPTVNPDLISRYGCLS